MKSWYLLLILALGLPVRSLLAQAPAPKDSTPAVCEWNLLNPIFTAIERTQKPVSYANPVMPDTYKDVSYTRDDDDFPCVTVNDCSGNKASLVYDVWYPLHDYSQQKLPAVILFHGGSLKECNGYDQEIMKDLCRDFAKRGFVTFNVEYRRGRMPDSRQKNFKTATEVLASYRALQDCRGAIRSIIKRQRLHDTQFPNDPYQVDTNNIFLGGVSAGAFLAVTAAWYTDEMIIEAHGGKDLPVTIDEALGPLDQDYYFGEPGIEIQSKIKGIVSLWGAISIPSAFLNREALFFMQKKPATLKPVIAFHGALDSTLPFYMNRLQLAYYSPPNPEGIPFNTESRCILTGPFVLPDNQTKRPDFISGSSLNMYYIARKIKQNMPFELYVDCQMGHGLDEEGPGFQSDFGTGYDNAQQVTSYIVGRSAIFLQAIMNNKKAEDIGPPAIFTDCVNNRKKCNKPDDPNPCNDFIICNP